MSAMVFTPFYFYPRPLRGGRHEFAVFLCWFGIFLSTPSARRATLAKYNNDPWDIISIHALCEEGDVCTRYRVPEGLISIHALCEEGDSLFLRLLCGGFRFLSTPSARRATIAAWSIEKVSPDFYPRPLRGGRPCHPGKNTFTSRFLSTPSARRATASDS